MTGEKNLSLLLKNMKPTLYPDAYIFASMSNVDHIKRADTLCEFKESEGITVVMEKSKADSYGLTYESAYARITLEVHSSLDAVGLTAAFSNELARNGISCNVIAGYHHDHIFVGKDDGEKAIRCLKDMSSKS